MKCNNNLTYGCDMLGAYSKVNLKSKDKNHIVFHVTGAQFVRQSEHITTDDVSYNFRYYYVRDMGPM